jgi:uncharacterized protein (TIGR03000 family)
VEASQTKGDSETTPRLSPTDEFANFERWDKANLPSLIATTPEMLPFNYVRSALKLGLEHQAKLGVNPFKFGLVGGTDIHTSLSTTRAENSFGIGVICEPKPDRWKLPFMENKMDPKLNTYIWETAPGALGGVWARENTREAIWDAMERRETYCTTGTRPVVRVFGGWDFTEKDLTKSDPVWVEQGYTHGVPMGGDLSNAPKGKAPAFMIKALCDPDGAYLDRVQIIKGWLDAKGQAQEKVIDVAWSGDRKPDPKTGKVPLVGDTVDVKNATWTNTIGAPVLTGFWQDPDFDPALLAFYYVRVIEIPTPTWQAYDCMRFGITMPDYAPMKVTNRAYTSSIWYSPAQGEQTNKLPAKDKQTSAPGDRKIRVRLIVPADAEVWFDGTKTSETGATRDYVSPALAFGKDYSYEIRVRWIANGQPVEQTRKVSVRPGALTTVDFTKSPPA